MGLFTRLTSANKRSLTSALRLRNDGTVVPKRRVQRHCPKGFTDTMISTVDQTRMPLLDALVEAGHNPHGRFYTPGHKGGRGAIASLLASLGARTLNLDIPEVPTLDNLFAPESVIHEAQVLAAKVFGAEQTYFLVNGSSGGLMAALLATCGPGDSIILPRTVHQSIVHGLILSGAHPIWVTPERDPDQAIDYCLTPAQLSLALKQYSEEYPEAKAIKAIAVVSPSYEGVCGDIASLAAIAHQHDIPLIVDEAHGAHFGLHADLPPSALSQGADLVVQSTHKMLGALTQASMLHVQGDRIHPGRLQSALRMLQTSSPSFLLLASLDAARYQVANQGQILFDEAIAIAQLAQDRLAAVPSLRRLTCPRSPGDSPPGFFALDPLRLTVILPPEGPSGFALDEWLLERANLIAEFPAPRHLTFLLGIGNSRQEVDHLVDHLVDSLKTFAAIVPPHTPVPPESADVGTYPAIARSTYPPQIAASAPAIAVNFEESIGMISQQTVCPYPPGVPVLFPGELITASALQGLRQAQALGGQVIGTVGGAQERLWVIPPP